MGVGVSAKNVSDAVTFQFFFSYQARHSGVVLFEQTHFVLAKGDECDPKPRIHASGGITIADDEIVMYQEKSRSTVFKVLE